MICKFTNDYLIESFTMVDNLFIREYMPYADEKQVKVYLYGLFLCNTESDADSFEEMAKTLDMTKEEIVDAFRFWSEQGLVRLISSSPLEVRYLSFKNNLKPVKKYKDGKFADFNTALQQLFPDRQIMSNEFHVYYEFLDDCPIDQDALIMIVQYCINLKGSSVRYPYILTVARSWFNDGVRTVDDVEEKLSEYEQQSEDMRLVLKSLSRKGGADLEEKQMLLKWTKNWGFSVSAIAFCAKKLKNKTFKKLDATLDEYYRLDIFTESQMQDYFERKAALNELAVKINKSLGVFYESLDAEIETYIQPWLQKGFDEEALVKVAHYCFLSGVRNLEGMKGVISKFYSEGALTVESINRYIAKQVEKDKFIKEILSKAGEVRSVIPSDREYLKIWESDWGFAKDVILYAASCSFGKTYPMKYMNQLLSSFKEQGAFSVEKAKTAFSAQPSNTAKQDYMQRDYTKEELEAIFKNSKNFDGSDIQ